MPISKINKGKKAGKYRVRIQPRDEHTGKVIPVPSQVADNYRAAKALYEKMWVDFRSNPHGNYQELSQPLVQSYKSFIESEHKLGRWQSATTYKAWTYTIRLLKDYFGDKKVKDITETDIRQFARDYVEKHHASVAPHATIERQLQNIRCYFGSLDNIVKNPVPVKALYKFFRNDEMTVPNEKYIFSDKEIVLIVTDIKEQLKSTRPNYWCSRLAIWIALETGMRPQEIQALKWSNLTNDHGKVVFEISDSWNSKAKELNGHLKSRPKGAKRLTLPISEALYQTLMIFKEKQAKVLQEYGLDNEQDYILLALTTYNLCSLGMPIDQRGLNDMMRKICKKIGVNNRGLRVSMYTCRHTIATKLANIPSMSYPWAAYRLGHSLKTFMKVYVHVDQDKNEDMLNVVSSQLVTQN